MNPKTTSQTTWNTSAVAPGLYYIRAVYTDGQNANTTPIEYVGSAMSRTPSREKARIRLPFQGDSLLSLILSKAFLLAEDSKIKDETILSQIRPRVDG